MIKLINKRDTYSAPAIETDIICPELICQSPAEGTIEGVSEEDWTL